jgi:predicted amidohydrolase
LRFPVFSRNDVGYDVALYIANWPDTRIAAWDVLLKARAIENQSYVIGLNRVGEDGYKALYSGHSQVLDAAGSLIAMAPENETGLIEFTLFKTPLLKLRKRHPFLRDADSFKLRN